MALIRIIKNRPLIQVRKGLVQIWHRSVTNEYMYVYVPDVIENQTANGIEESYVAVSILQVFYCI